MQVCVVEAKTGFALQAQVMTAGAAKPRLGPEPKPGKLAIMFFGTIEVTWSSSKDVCSWAQGIKDDLWSKNKHKNRQLFDLGVEQVFHPHLDLLQAPCARLHRQYTALLA